MPPPRITIVMAGEAQSCLHTLHTHMSGCQQSEDAADSATAGDRRGFQNGCCHFQGAAETTAGLVRWGSGQSRGRNPGLGGFPVAPGIGPAGRDSESSLRNHYRPSAAAAAARPRLPAGQLGWDTQAAGMLTVWWERHGLVPVHTGCCGHPHHQSQS